MSEQLMTEEISFSLEINISPQCPACDADMIALAGEDTFTCPMCKTEIMINVEVLKYDRMDLRMHVWCRNCDDELGKDHGEDLLMEPLSEEDSLYGARPEEERGDNKYYECSRCNRRVVLIQE